MCYFTGSVLPSFSWRSGICHKNPYCLANVLLTRFFFWKEQREQMESLQSVLPGCRMTSGQLQQESCWCEKRWGGKVTDAVSVSEHCENNPKKILQYYIHIAFLVKIKVEICRCPDLRPKPRQARSALGVVRYLLCSPRRGGWKRGILVLTSTPRICLRLTLSDCWLPFWASCACDLLG